MVDGRTVRVCDYYGSKNPNAKLNEEKVKYIKEAHATGTRVVDLANEFGVSRSNISNILAKRIWRHI